MSDEQQRDFDGEATGEPAPARRRFGGFADRFRRQRPDPTPPPVDDDEFALAEPPVPAARTTPPGANPSDTNLDAADHLPTADDDPEADGSPASSVAGQSDSRPEPRPEPHPELHPALRAPAARDAIAEPERAADVAKPEAGTPTIAASRVEEISTPKPVPPVAEERIAFTARPAPPLASAARDRVEQPAEPPVAPPSAPANASANASASAPTDVPSLDESELDETTPTASDLADDGSEGIAAAGFLDESEGGDDAPVGLRRRTMAISAYLAVLTALATVVILAFVLIEPTPRWLLILGAGAVILGLDGTLRQTWREPFAMGQETAPFLFVPALFMLAVPVLVEHNITGEAVVLAALGAGLAFGTLAWAELASVRAFGAEYPQARTIVTGNTYLVGFAIFSLTYVYSIPLPAAILACGIAAAMLAVEVLREGEIDPAETLGLSLVVGVVIAEARWLFYYASLDTYLAGLTLLLVFYLVTGLLHSHVVRAFSPTIAAQYGGITAAGLALVIVARAAGLA